jgi:hypothetical protein
MGGVRGSQAPTTASQDPFTYTGSMPTPVGPVPPDPNDPELWDWGEDDDDIQPRRQPWRLVLVGIIVLGLVLLLLVGIF